MYVEQFFVDGLGRASYLVGCEAAGVAATASRVAELDETMPVAVVCAHGNRSQSAAALRGQKGFKKVYNLLGGTAAWQQAGLEISRNGYGHKTGAR